MFYLSYREYGLSKMVSSHLFYRVRWIIPERLGKLRVQKGEPCMKLDKQTYQQLLERKSPNSPLWRDCLLAFLIGGAICTVGEGVRQLWLSRGLDTEDTAAATAITMVFLGALLTCLHLYEKLAKYAGQARLCRSPALQMPLFLRRWSSKARGLSSVWAQSCLLSRDRCWYTAFRQASFTVSFCF